MLDVGCGIGDMLSYRQNTVGLDVNPLNVDFCQKRQLEAHMMKPDIIPFRDETFDSVLLDNVLEHIEKPSLLFKEIRRVLKPDGILLIGVPGIKGYQSDDDHKVFYDEKKLHVFIRSGLSKNDDAISRSLVCFNATPMAGNRRRRDDLFDCAYIVTRHAGVVLCVCEHRVSIHAIRDGAFHSPYSSDGSSFY